MKNPKRNRIRSILGWTLLASAMVGLFGFVSDERDKERLKGIRVRVGTPEGVHFMNEERARSIVEKNFGPLDERPIHNLPLEKMERVLSKKPAVGKAELFVSIEGTLRIELDQREPVLRMIDREGKGSYLDKSGKLMPLSSRYTAHVPVITGDFHLSWWKGSGEATRQDSPSAKLSASEKSMVKGVKKLGKILRESRFWQAQIQQVTLGPAGKATLIPRLGDQRILFGKLRDQKNKFRKLMAFYQNSLGNTDWKQYDTLDLRFEDQIVCKKE